MSTRWRPLRVLVVDDSAMVRKLAEKKLQQQGRLEVVATVRSAEAAYREIVLNAPEVLLIDKNLPGMNGVEFLRKVMSQNPIPSVMFSAGYDEELRAQALRDGAVAVIKKPTGFQDQQEFWQTLEQTLITAAHAKIRFLPNPGAPPRVIGIAISTGGPPVVKQVLSELPATLPPIVIVQHMRDHFLPSFAEQLDADTSIRVKLGGDGETLQPGHCYIAPAGQQTLVVRSQGKLRLKFGPGVLISGHMPSGDALLSSIACSVGGFAVGAVLTGMGADGAAGLLAMRRAGAVTIAQDRQTSTVYGMPKAAAENGAARIIVPLGSISSALQRTARQG